MAIYIRDTPDTTVQGSFYAAILAIKRSVFDAADKHIDNARRMLASELSGLVGESYNRAYRQMVMVQQLAELEEIVTYMRLQSSGRQAEADDYLKHVRRMWDERILCVQRGGRVRRGAAPITRARPAAAHATWTCGTTCWASGCSSWRPRTIWMRGSSSRPCAAARGA